MLVYRVQNDEARGPYSVLTYGHVHGDGRFIPSGSHDTFAHPEPSEDGLNHDVRMGKQYGFASREQFDAWFDTATRERLAARGFHLAVYDVPEAHVARGRSQIAFAIERATLMQKEAL